MSSGPATSLFYCKQFPEGDEESNAVTTENGPSRMADLDGFVGAWQMTASFTGDPLAAETSFAWLAGSQFLVQRWQIDHPDAPDGIAIIGYDADRATYVQHYFDSRGVARIYDMTFADGVWGLLRIAPGFSQRFTGTFSEDGGSIVGGWESSDDGAHWTPDFDLTYTRVEG
jgi:hypothetical protein